MSRKTIAKSILREMPYMRFSQTKEKFLKWILEGFTKNEVISVVRCKDCKRHIDGKCYSSSLMPNSHVKLGDFVGDDWYCADGEKKESE